MRCQALTYILTTDLDGVPHFAFDFEDDVSLFVADDPLPPDLADVDALKDWHEALKEATLQPVLTMFGPQSDPAENVYAWDRVGESPGFDGRADRETTSGSTDCASPINPPVRGQR